MPNDSKYSLVSICSSFLHEWNSDLLICSQISELFHLFNVFITYVYVMLFSCMLVSIYELTLLSAFTSRPVSLLATTKESIFFFIA